MKLASESDLQRLDDIIEELEKLRQLLATSLVTEYVGIKSLSPLGEDCPLVKQAAIKMLNDNKLRQLVEECSKIGAVADYFEWIKEDYLSGFSTSIITGRT
jgi:hypothetical protein